MNEKLKKKDLAKKNIKSSVIYGNSPKEWNLKLAPIFYYVN